MRLAGSRPFLRQAVEAVADTVKTALLVALEEAAAFRQALVVALAGQEFLGKVTLAALAEMMAVAIMT